MSSIAGIGFPRQKLPLTRKGKKWREDHLKWADNNSYLYNNFIRESLKQKKINFDLYNNIVHLDDMKKIINPLDKKIGLIPKDLQHYPIINNPLNVLIGEEAKRKHDFFLKVVNDEAVSTIEEEKMAEAQERIMQFITSTSDEETAEKELASYQEYFNYGYQNLRELRANHIMRHYIKELDFDRKMNQGFKDVTIVAEESFQFDISHGEPTMEALNPRKLYTLKSGYSNRIEDADIIIYDDYWSPSKILDNFFDKLSTKDQEYIEEISNKNITNTDSMQNKDERDNFIYGPFIDSEQNNNILDQFAWLGQSAGLPNSRYVDSAGNIRVLRIYWKSKRKIKEVKSYNQETGAVEYNYREENFVIDKDAGEEEKIMWINEVWEGTKIGEKVYTNIRPKPVQYLRMSNPSKCHAGIIGQIYNTNESRPVSLLDRMKPNQYLYDSIKDRLVKTIARNYGKILRLDKARVPTGWGIEKWLYFVEQDGISVEDSFNEGNKGVATGKLAGNFQSTGNSIDMELGNSIQSLMNILEYLKDDCYEISGVSKQRQGQISNRETVGGIERSVEQSSHITEELFNIHDNVRKRCLECLVETAKMALKGRSMKLPYVTDDRINKILDVDGDEFAESDYGLIVDNDLTNVELKQKLEQIAHAWSQNETVKPDTILDIYTNPSLSIIKRKIKKDIADNEAAKAKEQENAMKQQQAALQAQQVIAEQQKQLEYDKLEMEDIQNQRDNDTKLQIAMLGKEGEDDVEVDDDSKKLALQKEKQDKDFQLRERQLAETERSNRAKEIISKQKPKTSSK